ncbi:MAG: CotH kinase family protein [Candidatus Fermentibacteraceae bacterium]|nr:CotH kinase family protein [Candidatus Fermentibacteraceae bacterium]
MRSALIAFLVVFICNAGLIPEDHPFFQEAAVHEVHIQFDQDDFWDVLEANYASEMYLEAEFWCDDFSLETVGVRFKGGSSYTTNPTLKKSFKIDFDVFVEDQNIEGIYKINLNCNYNDPSFVREAAAYEICRASDIPCPRTSFAALYINDTYWGLYTLVEQFDKHFIEERFGESEDGNLWKGDNHGTLEFAGWNPEDYYGDYELKTNESENDWTELMELTDRLNNTPAAYLTDSLSEVMDVNTALVLLAVDNLTVNLDSYAGRGVNYYLYHMDRDDRFVFGEWDMNESWGCFNSWNYSISELQELPINWTNVSQWEERPLADVLWSVDTWYDVYRGHLLRMMAQEANPDILIPRMEEMRNLIRDWVYLEEYPRSLFSPDQFEEAMDSDIPIGPGRFAPALGIFIENRHEYLVSLLGTWESVDDIILNELMAGNDSTIADENGEYDDWIEIVNTGTDPVDLSSFRLTDDMAFPGKYIFPDTVIQPGGYMLIWADDESEQGSLHAEFKLNGDGEEVYLMQGSVVIDQITFPDLSDDDSWGRWPDLGEGWVIQAYPTPGAPNTGTQPGEGGWEAGSTLSILCPNPVRYGSAEAILNGISGTAVLSLFDLSGRLVLTPFQGELNGQSTVGLETEQLPAGVYVLRLIQGGLVISQLVTIIK